MSSELKLIGKRIQRTRRKRGLSQAQLAERLKLSSVHISEIERGLTNCSISIFKGISEALDISADWLLLIDSPASKACAEDEISELLDGCTQREYELIFGMAKSLKDSLSTIYDNSDSSQNDDSK